MVLFLLIAGFAVWAVGARGLRSAAELVSRIPDCNDDFDFSLVGVIPEPPQVSPAFTQDLGPDIVARNSASFTV
jgi:hypothetical protein